MGIIHVKHQKPLPLFHKWNLEFDILGITPQRYSSEVKPFYESLEGFYSTSQDHFSTFGFLPYRKFEIRDKDFFRLLPKVADFIENDEASLELKIKDRGCLLDKMCTNYVPLEEMKSFNDDFSGVVGKKSLQTQLGYQNGILVLEKTNGEIQRRIELEPINYITKNYF